MHLERWYIGAMPYGEKSYAIYGYDGKTWHMGCALLEFDLVKKTARTQSQHYTLGEHN